MKTRFCLLLLFLLGGTWLRVEANAYRFRSIGIADGLPDNYIKNVFGLPDGRLGVRTSVLLNFYDGRNFITFPLWMSHNYRISFRSIVPVQYIDGRERLWLKERELLQVFDLEKEQFVSADSIFRKWGMNTRVADLFVDSRKNIWLVDVHADVYRCDDASQRAERVLRAEDYWEEFGGLVELDAEGDRCWMVHAGGMTRCYDREQRRFVGQVPYPGHPLEANDQAVLRMLSGGDFWLMWTGGLGYYDSAQKQLLPVEGFSGTGSIDLVSMDTDARGSAWIGTSQQGLYTVDRRTLRAENAGPLFSRYTGGDVKNIHSIYIDKSAGTVWLGFFNRGIACYHPCMDNFPVFNSDNVSGGWTGENIHCLLEADNGEIWMGTQAGLYCYNPATHSMRIPVPALARALCRTLCRDRQGRLWVGTYAEGLYCVDRDRVTRYLTENRDGVEASNVRCVLEDRKGRLWVSVRGGVGRLNPDDGTLEMLPDKFPALARYKLANTLALDDTGRLVVGADNGLYIYSPDEDKVWIPEDEVPESPLVTQGSNKFNSLLQDSRGLLWMGTQYGIKIMDKDRRVDFLGLEHGFANATVQSICEDDAHRIWVATVNAIYCIEVKPDGKGRTYMAVCMDRNNTREWNDLYDFCSLRTHDGKIIFGKMNGFCMFNPADIVPGPPVPPPVFTSFRLFNEPVACGERRNGRVLFPKAIDRMRRVTLEHEEDFIALDFAGLNYTEPSQTYFRYKMDGLEEQWTEVLAEAGGRAVTFSSLPPGEYLFRVQSAGKDHRWGAESTFAITVRPPFWNTTAARVVYAVCLVACLGLLALYIKRRNNRKLLRMQEREAARQKEELNQMKFRFFTNVSHELRTPLTLIITPLEILRKKVDDKKMLHQLNVIYKNAQELYGLVNQLLDFRKVEMQREKLLLAPGDVGEFLQAVYGMFLPFSAEKQLDFKLDVEDGHWFMYFDHDKLHKMVNNLLSNAFKFTPAGGSVVLGLSHVEEEGRKYVCITVTDTGIGMPAEQLPHIFERFYQVQNGGEAKVGSGIGLHLVKEYMQIHQGQVKVESTPGKGTRFTLLLPADLKPEEADGVHAPLQAAPQQAGEAVAATPPATRKKLLVVEDNHDVRAFLKEQLEETYEVYDAPDGEAGEKLAVEHDPDLIISDIMMPKVDGIELCRRIKTNVQTSHIPVILLTARTADDVKLTGYGAGADSYMPKPFNFDILLVRIAKLIEQQEKRRQEFRQNVQVNPSSITITPLDEQLIQKALEQIEQHMDNPEYSVESLSSGLGMSRMNLYRKLQAITGQTPTEFIRSIRLKRAAQLLQGSQLTIAEVADRVGFSSSSYFTKCFKEQFGVLPTQYAENADYWAK